MTIKGIESFYEEGREPPGQLRPAHLRELFTSGTRLASGCGEIAITVRHAGTLRLTTGQVVAADRRGLSSTASRSP